MKRILMTLTLMVGFSAALPLLNLASAVAGGGYSARDLSGVYVFNLAEIRIEYDYSSGVPVPVTDYCDHSGTLNADGVGTMIVSDTRRCSFTGLITKTDSLIYSVNPDGSVLITEPGYPAEGPTHGQIVNRGGSLLIDGTTRTNPNVLMFHGTAMQR